MLLLERLRVFARHEPGEWLHTRRAFEVARDGWGVAVEFNAWLRRRIGPTAEVMRGR